MKKLLSLLATTCLVATTSSAVVLCGEETKNKNVTLNKKSIEVIQGGNWWNYHYINKWFRKC